MYSIYRNYKSTSEDLRTSEVKDDIHREHLISTLTQMAHQEMRGTKAIVDAVRDHWKKVSYSSRFYIINLIHSIVKSVGGE